jgi:transposase
MSKSKPYSAVPVNRVVLESVTRGRAGHEVVLGCDIGKYEILAVPRWGNNDFCRPWCVANPEQIVALVRLLVQLGKDRRLRVALEPSGTYGDPLRQACHDAGLSVCRVSPKAAHDYAEIFDGVPSQHDGKDAAVVAELAAWGKAAVWPYQVRSSWEQELAYHVDCLETQRQLLVLWSGRLEGLLARHWPEATRVVKVTRATLLHAVAHYGGPAALAADEQAETRLRRWAHCPVSEDKLHRLLVGARSSVGIRQGAIDKRRLQECAGQALAALQHMRRSRRELARLVRSEPVLQAQAQVVGNATAAVLWAALGDPRDYECGEAYRKAMGLNLTEYSSGTRQGELHISKRGHPQTRRWLYLAALRLVKQPGVKQWYQAKKQRDAEEAKGAVVGVMRRLVLALYQVGVKGATFEVGRLFGGRMAVGAQKSSASAPAERESGQRGGKAGRCRNLFRYSGERSPEYLNKFRSMGPSRKWATFFLSLAP